MYSTTLNHCLLTWYCCYYCCIWLIVRPPLKKKRKEKKEKIICIYIEALWNVSLILRLLMWMPTDGCMPAFTDGCCAHSCAPVGKSGYLQSSNLWLLPSIQIRLGPSFPVLLDLLLLQMCPPSISRRLRVAQRGWFWFWFGRWLCRLHVHTYFNRRCWRVWFRMSF